MAKPNHPQVKRQRQEASQVKQKAPVPPPDSSSASDEDGDQQEMYDDKDSSQDSPPVDMDDDQSDSPLEGGDEEVDEEETDGEDEINHPKPTTSNNRSDSKKQNSVVNSSSSTLHDTAAAAPSSSQSHLSFNSDGRYHNKQRCLTICSRGATARFRHLLEDLRTLIPHHKKDSKLDAKKSGGDSTGKAVNEIAEIMGCNTAVFLECRKHQDAYLWVGMTPNSSSSSHTGGPSAKFLVENVHTMDELRLTGNSMKGSRPILSFDTNFDTLAHLKILKCLFMDVFGTPRGHPKSKPFVDRVMGFYYADGKIWVRNYQIVEQQATTAKEARMEMKLHGQDVSTSLTEIGPRFVLNPIRIFRGSFGGQTLYQNKDFVSPNTVRSLAMRKKGQAYQVRKDSQKKRKSYQETIVVPENPLDSVFK